MEQGALLECYHCRLLYPGLVGCPVCGGSGTRFQPAQMADDRQAHAILEDALARLDGSRAALVEALILWQLYGRAYARVERGAGPEAERHVQDIGRELVARLRAQAPCRDAI